MLLLLMSDVHSIHMQAHVVVKAVWILPTYVQIIYHDLLAIL